MIIIKIYKNGRCEKVAREERKIRLVTISRDSRYILYTIIIIIYVECVFMDVRATASADERCASKRKPEPTYRVVTSGLYHSRLPHTVEWYIILYICVYTLAREFRDLRCVCWFIIYTDTLFLVGGIRRRVSRVRKGVSQKFPSDTDDIVPHPVSVYRPLKLSSTHTSVTLYVIIILSSVPYY